MHVGVDVTCLHVDFGGWGLSGFGDIATLKNDQISLSEVVEKFNRLELAQKIYACRG